MRLIINADDFGYTKGVNYGIVEAHERGIVTSTTMMCNMPASEHAFALMQHFPSLGVGVHIVLDSGYPVSNNVPSLVDEHGRFYQLPELVERATDEDIEREVRAQIERFLSFGVRPTHLDSHHHVHGHERILPIVRKLAMEYQLPLRRYALVQDDDVVSTNTFIHEFYGDNLTRGRFVELLEQGEGFQTVEMMTHPAYLDAELYTKSSYSVARVNELAILTDPWVRKEIEKREITLISYRDLR